MGCLNSCDVDGHGRPFLDFHTLDVDEVGHGSLLMGLDAQVINADVPWVAEGISGIGDGCPPTS